MQPRRRFLLFCLSQLVLFTVLPVCQNNGRDCRHTDYASQFFSRLLLPSLRSPSVKEIPFKFLHCTHEPMRCLLSWIVLVVRHLTLQLSMRYLSSSLPPSFHFSLYLQLPTEDCVFGSWILRFYLSRGFLGYKVTPSREKRSKKSFHKRFFRKKENVW
jgi:hypothetical protein